MCFSAQFSYLKFVSAYQHNFGNLNENGEVRSRWVKWEREVEFLDWNQKVETKQVGNQCEFSRTNRSLIIFTLANIIILKKMNNLNTINIYFCEVSEPLGENKRVY